MITKSDLEKRVIEVRLERDAAVMQLGAYNGVIGELERLISSFNSDNKKEK